jgi:TetR/AcrR family transcriptional repressor of nem operon
MARPRQFDEEKMLAVVRDEFASKGFEATSLDDLMRVTGLGKGSIYAAFGDKHQLFLSALRLYSDATRSAMHAALSSDKPAIEKLRMLFQFPENGKSRTQPYRGCFLANSTTELAAHDCDVRDLARQTYQGILTEVVEQAKRDGDLARTPEPAELGRLILVVLQGIEFLRKSGMTAEEVHAIGHLAEQLLLRGDESWERAKPSSIAVAASTFKKTQQKKQVRGQASAAKTARPKERE